MLEKLIRKRTLCDIVFIALTLGCTALNASRPSAAIARETLEDAVGAWQFDTLSSIDDLNPLTPHGDVIFGIPLEGDERLESQRRGGNGFVAQINRGHFNAGQGANNRFQIEGSAMSLLLRFKNSGEFRNGELFSKHGGHTQTLFNFFINRGDIGFEFGTETAPRLAANLRFSLNQLEADAWHDLIAVYNGRVLELFLNGALIQAIPASGNLRKNDIPLIVGRAMNGQLVDQVALWNRALSNSEIAALSGLSQLPDAFHGAGPANVSTDGPDRVLSPFRDGTFGDWVVTGTAFGEAPREGVASSVHPERNQFGTLTSPEFIIDRQFINFLVGGNPRYADVRLLIHGQPVYTVLGATPNKLYPWSWNVSDYIGMTAQIEIRDSEHPRAPAFGHIKATDFILSNRSALHTLERQITLSDRFLNIPVSRTGRSGLVEMLQGETLFRRSQDDGRMGDGRGFNPPENGDEGLWLAMDMTALMGEELTLRFSNIPPSRSEFIDRIYVSEFPHKIETLYTEKLRPRFHFTPRTGWLNDPNGMVYFNGLYHLFFQHNALGFQIANQAWGHAVSKDLIHWEELPPVMEPYSFSKGRSFSGSAIIDRQNRAGFGHNAMIAIYTDTSGGAAQHGLFPEGPRGEVIAYSLDEGLTFHYYEGNPVHTHRVNGRDPKVIWWPEHDAEQQDPNGHWVMITYTVYNGEDHAQILVSDDLKNWEETDLIPNHYECMELFKLPVLDANNFPTGETKWFLQGGNGTYHQGDFDGRVFHLDSPTKQRTLRVPGYAWQRFNDAPDGRIIMIGWIRRHTGWENMPFTQMMSIPLEMTARETPDGLRLFANPVAELNNYRNPVLKKENIELRADSSFDLGVVGQHLDLELTFVPAEDSGLTVHFGADQVTWLNGRLNDLVDLPLREDGSLTLRVLVDRPLIEVIGNDGSIYLPMARKEEGRDVSIRVSGHGQMLGLALYEINAHTGPHAVLDN